MYQDLADDREIRPPVAAMEAFLPSGSVGVHQPLVSAVVDLPVVQARARQALRTSREGGAEQAALRAKRPPVRKIARRVHPPLVPRPAGKVMGRGAAIRDASQTQQHLPVPLPVDLDLRALGGLLLVVIPRIPHLIAVDDGGGEPAPPRRRGLQLGGEPDPFTRQPERWPARRAVGGPEGTEARTPTARPRHRRTPTTGHEDPYESPLRPLRTP